MVAPSLESEDNLYVYSDATRILLYLRARRFQRSKTFSPRRSKWHFSLLIFSLL